MIDPPPLMVAAIIPAQARKYVAQESSQPPRVGVKPILRHISRNATYRQICGRPHICLNEDMISVNFLFDMAPVFGRLAMKILIAVPVAQRNHVFHPEMIGEGTNLARGLFETVFNFET
jgi:hypothetical protein